MFAFRFSRFAFRRIELQPVATNSFLVTALLDSQRCLFSLRQEVLSRTPFQIGMRPVSNLLLDIAFHLSLLAALWPQ
jgi:hypothetical protein